VLNLQLKANQKLVIIDAPKNDVPIVLGYIQNQESKRIQLGIQLPERTKLIRDDKLNEFINGLGKNQQHSENAVAEPMADELHTGDLEFVEEDFT